MSVAAQFEANASEDLSSPFYFNASHWRAMDGVVEGAKNREGIMVMTGPTGSGKTMLMRAISDNLGEGVTPLFLQYASLNFREFVNFLHNSLNVGDEILDASNKAVALRKYLYAQAERHESAVVFVDEAQNLEPDVLRMLPKLACFDQLEDGTNVGLQFMLTGGSELREVLEDPDFVEVRDAVARQYELRFFTREELKYFLEKRLAPLARMTPEPITDTAVEAVGKYTGGSPRLIGMICSHAMLFAAENPGRSIDESMIEEAAEALMIEPVENPFGHEDDDAAELAGPFSSADLTGESRNAAADSADLGTEMDTDMPIAEAASDTYDDDAIYKASDQDTDDDTDTFYDPVTALEARSKTDDAMDDMAKGLDVDAIDDEFDDADFDDEDDQFEAAKVGVAAGAAAGAGSILSRVKSKFDSAREGRRGNTTRLLGAGRKGGATERAAEPTEARKMKTRVAGQREKQIKYGIYAAAFSGLVFGVYMIRADITTALASVSSSVSSTTSTAVEQVKTATTKSAEAVGRVGGSIKTTALDTTMKLPSFGSPSQEQPAVESVDVPTPSAPAAVTQTPKLKVSGWGAKVEVIQDDVASVLPGTDIKMKVPEAGVGLARGALDLVDQVIDAGAEAAPENVRGAFQSAKADVDSLRKSVTINGASEEEQVARVEKLISEADALFKRQLYIAPRGGNAYDSYRAALDIDETNEAALRGIENLRAFYSQKADAARSAKQWDRANRHFETALAISKLKPVR